MRYSTSYTINLGCRKKDGLISCATISDFRSYFYEDYVDRYKPGAQSSERTLEPDELMALNRECIKQRYVMAGGTLYKPELKSISSLPLQQKQNAWYNPLGFVWW